MAGYLSPVYRWEVALSQIGKSGKDRQMRSPIYYKVRMAVRVGFWLSLLAGLYLIATHIWWVDGGYCIGNLEVCGL
jgi:hypothetical protein